MFEPVPAIVFPSISESNYYQALSAQLLVFPFTLNSGGAVDIVVVQSVAVEDNSLQCWVSTAANGVSIVTSLPNNVAVWHANRIPNKHVTVYDAHMEPPASLAPLATMPGNYFLNVRNLINRTSTFYMALTVS